MHKLKALRNKQCFSQREIAAKAGIATSTYNRIETGLEVPMPITKRKIAAALGVEPAQIQW